MSAHSLGAETLLKKYKWDRLKVAEALLMGKLDSLDQDYVEEVVSERILSAAKFRIANKLNIRAKKKH